MAGKSAVVKVAIVADNSSLNRGLKQSQSKLAGFAKSVAKIGVAAGAAAGVGLALFAKSAVDAASDAQQSIGATETVFGKFAGSVIKSSNAAADAVGLSANAYRENANVLGSLLANQGVSADKLAGKTKALIKQGADLAATFGGTTTEAVQALSSAFKGEFDPLERYGISIKQSTINTEAYRVAGVKTAAAFGALTQAQQVAAKQQATTNLLQQQGAKSQGAFASESDTLAHKQQVLAAQFDNVKVAIGNALLPIVTKLVQYLSDHFIPKLEELADWLNDNQGEIEKWAGQLGDAAKDAGDLGKTVAQTLYPPLKDLGEIMLSLVQWFNDLPGPIKKIGAEAAVAAVLIWKLSPAFTAVKASAQLAAAQVKQFGAEMTYTETRRATLTGGLAKLGGAAKAAAGVGGMVALTEGASQSNQGLKTLMQTAGGAATGFAVAGPWGAAIGGAAGLLFSLKDAFKDTEQAARDAARAAEKTQAWESAKESVKQLTDALHGTVQAYNDVTAAAVQQGFRDADGQLLPWVQHLEDAGVSVDTLTRAILGQKDAQGLLEHAQGNVDANLKARKDSLDIATKAYNDYTASIEKHNAETGGVGPTGHQIDKMNELADAVQSTKNQYEDYKTEVDSGNKALSKYGQTVDQQNALERTRRASLGLTKKAYDAIPTEVRTKVEEQGAPQTKAAVLDFIKTAKLVPREVVSVLKATGTEVSKAQAKALGIEYDKLPNEVTTRGRFDPGSSKADANRAGADAGSSFGSGYTAGIASWTGRAEYAARAMAAAAQAAAKHQDMSRSPSKVMMKAGKDFGDGYRIGIERTKKPVSKAAADLAKAAQNGVKNGSSGIAAALERVGDIITKTLDKQLAERQKSIKKRLDGKAEDTALKRLEKRWKTHTKAVTKALRDERAALTANGKAQDALASGNYLTYLSKQSKLYKDMVKAGVHNIQEAKQHLADLKQQSKDYAASIKESFVSFGDITQLGQNEDGTVSGANLIDQLKQRVIKAKQFATDIKKLQALNLNKAQIDQMLAAGPEAAAATAAAIVAGGKTSVDEINNLSNQLAAAGGDLGSTLSDKYYSAGIKAAQGIVKGLEHEADNLDKAAVNLANKLVKAVKKALGIKSPSKVFMSMGDNVSRGLALGIDDTHVTRAGQGMASSLINAFGSPNLSAQAAIGSGSKSEISIKLTAQERSAIERGREIRFDLDAYESAGGRRAAQ